MKPPTLTEAARMLGIAHLPMRAAGVEDLASCTDVGALGTVQPTPAQTSANRTHEVPCPACGGSGYSPTTYMDAQGYLQGDKCHWCKGACVITKEKK